MTTVEIRCDGYKKITVAQGLISKSAEIVFGDLAAPYLEESAADKARMEVEEENRESKLKDW